MIIAVDFDGILCKDSFPEIGEPNYMVISLIRQLKDKGHQIILWTSRIGDRLTEAVEWCEDYGLYFDSINDNIESNINEYGTNPRKVYADIYVDDHNLECISSLDGYGHIVDYLQRGVKRWQKEN